MYTGKYVEIETLHSGEKVCGKVVDEYICKDRFEVMLSDDIWYAIQIGFIVRTIKEISE